MEKRGGQDKKGAQWIKTQVARRADERRCKSNVKTLLNSRVSKLKGDKLTFKLIK